MIDLYTWATPNGRKISILMEELKVEYKVFPINIMKNEPNLNQDDFKKSKTGDQQSSPSAGWSSR